MSFHVIVTLGPSIMDADQLKRIASSADCIFRVNGAHFDDMERVRQLIQFCRRSLGAPKIMIDLPGNKIRVAYLDEPITLVAGKTFNLFSHQFNYKEFYQLLRPGQIIMANDSLFRFEVIAADATRIELLSHSNGSLANNKGMHTPGVSDNLPFLFERDRQLIRIGLQEDVFALGLSFVRSADDVKEVAAIVGERSIRLISKVEKIAAVENLESILDVVEYILIDRGDLSTETGMLHLPYYQNLIIESAKRKGKKVILATQFLKNMESKPIPVIPEVIDLFNTFRLGIAGIQLSEETAIGQFPEECVEFIMAMHRVAQLDYEPTPLRA